MFGERELAQVNPAYFNIIVVTDMDVTVQSKNSGDYWYLHCTGYPNEESCIIFHKHRYSHPYHQHGRANSLGHALRSIRGHDRWQLAGRPKRVKNVN